MIELRKVKKENQELLFNIFQKMLYEMTQFYDDKMDDVGNYHYGYFDEYFIDPKRIAYFIYLDEQLIGFIMLHPYSYFDECDYNIAEFTIFPHYRKHGYAEAAFKLLLDKHQGCFEVKYHQKNIKAMNFWHKVTKPYAPVLLSYDVFEDVLKFKVLKDD